jgi:hypothetical protein
MRGEPTSVREFLEMYYLAKKKNAFSVAESRSRIEQSGLPDLMETVSRAINGEAGRVIVDAHFYLSPQPLVNSFTFVRDDTEYVMQLEVGAANPVVKFVVRKWEDHSRSDFVRWVLRLLGCPPLHVSVAYTYEILERASEKNVQRWFFFLLSGFNSRFLPESSCEETLTLVEFRDSTRPTADETCL